jgi:hypothetical protein
MTIPFRGAVIESFFSQDDQLQSALTAIQAEFSQLEGQIAAADKLPSRA